MSSIYGILVYVVHGGDWNFHHNSYNLSLVDRTSPPDDEANGDLDKGGEQDGIDSRTQTTTD